jgi:hypothetical protein
MLSYMGDIMIVSSAAAPHLSCCCSVPYAGLEGVLLLVFLGILADVFIIC